MLERIVVAVAMIILAFPSVGEVSTETKKTEPWKRDRRQREEVLAHLSGCAVGKMSAAAKLEIAKRLYASDMQAVKARKESRLHYSVGDGFGFDDGCHRDITEPLVRSCLDLNVEGPELRWAECRTIGALGIDEEFRSINSPYRAKLQAANKEMNQILKARTEKEKVLQRESEEWLFKK